MSYTTGLTPSGLPHANDTTQAESIGAASRSQASSRSGAPTASAAEIATDSAKLSLAGAMLSQAATGSDVRFDKVAALRQSIESGTYSVSAADVAARLVDTLLE